MSTTSRPRRRQSRALIRQATAETVHVQFVMPCWIIPIGSPRSTPLRPQPFWEAPQLAEDTGQEQHGRDEHHVDAPQCLVDVGQLVCEPVELRLELLREVVPTLRRLAIMGNVGNPGAVL